MFYTCFLNRRTRREKGENWRSKKNPRKNQGEETAGAPFEGEHTLNLESSEEKRILKIFGNLP